MIRSTWPLPASSTTSAGRAISIAWRIASRDPGSGTGRDRAAGRPPRRRRPSPRGCAIRSSSRGSSSVSTTMRDRSPAARPIIGRLAMSRAPGDPNTEMRPPPRAAAMRRERVERRGQRAGRVSEVDVDAERLAFVDRHHPPGDVIERCKSAPHRVRVEPERLADPERGQRVEGVEPADELDVRARPPSAAFGRAVAAHRPCRATPRPDVGLRVGIDGVGQHAAPRHRARPRRTRRPRSSWALITAGFGQPLSGLVGADGESVEERALGGDVGLDTCRAGRDARA